MDKNTKIGVITYNIPHRKTYDTLCYLKASGYNNIIVFAEKLKYVKKTFPIIAHRPPTSNDLMPETLCKNFGYEYHDGMIREDLLKEGSIVLLCGAGLLENEIVTKYRIINSHPGYIPLSRGLDSFKWAIWNNTPIGVTTHIIGDEIDAGEVIERIEIPIYINDTFHQLAYRVYENEIKMLVEALDKLENRIYISGEGHEINRRMPAEIEHQLPERFETIRKERGKPWNSEI